MQKLKKISKAITISMMTGLILILILPAGGPNSLSSGSPTSGSIGAASTELPTKGDLEIDYIEDLQYIAIGPERFRDDLQPLIDWKTQKGVRAKFYPMDKENGILENYEDRDTQAEIRSFIRDVKEVNPSLKWVLLAGDGEILPSRRTFTNESYDNGGEEEVNYVNSDFYYAGLTGSWDQNGNEVYGEYMEQDWEADVYVGRFPASNEKEIRTMVSKQLSYEKDPPTGSWSESMLLTGSLMDTPNNPLAFQSYKDNAYELVLNVERDLPDHITPFHLVDYPKLEYGGYNQMFDTLNRTSFESFYEMGHSTVLIACHGDPFNGNCTNYKGEGGGRWEYIRDYEDHFTYDMAQTIENGERLSLVYISSCASTTFMEEDDTNMERLLRNPDGGAIALIGATVDTYRGEFRPDPNDPDKNTSYGNWWLAQEYFRLLFSGTTRPGEALYKQKWNYIGHVEDEYSYDPQYFRMFYIDNLAYNLLGDPEGPIWTQRPRELKASYPQPMVYDNGSIEVTVTDKDGSTPINKALVTITCNGDPETYVTGMTGSNGKVKIDLERNDLNDLTITITKDGYIPLIEIIDVYSNMNIAIDNVELIPTIPVGKQDMAVHLSISNIGERDIEAIQIHLVLNDDIENGELIPVLNLLSGATINKTIELAANRPVYGANHLDANVEIVSFQNRKIIESDPADNIRTLEFRANHPIEVSDSLPRIKIDEDSSLSADHGPLNLTEPYIFDFDDYPKNPRVWAEVLQGELRIELTGTLLDVIPALDWSGNGRIRIYATDGSVTRNGTMDVEVIPRPDPPQFIEYPGSFETWEDGTDSFQIILEDIDSDEVELVSDTQWISIERTDNETALVFNITMMPTEENLGETIIRLTAFDESNRTAEIRISIYVRSTNDPPMANVKKNLSFSQGSRNEVTIDIEDPDGDTDFILNISWEFGTFSSDYSNFTLDIPDDAGPGSYPLLIRIDDGNGGVTTLQETVTITEKSATNSFLFTGLIIFVIIIALLTYGIALRIQENRQKRMLDSVGTNATLEAKNLTEKDFNRTKRRRKGRDDGIPMPPAPSDVEGALIKEEKKEDRSELRSYTREQRDIEMDIDDVLSEMFPMDKG